LQAAEKSTPTKNPTRTAAIALAETIGARWWPTCGQRSRAVGRGAAWAVVFFRTPADVGWLVATQKLHRATAPERSVPSPPSPPPPSSPSLPAMQPTQAPLLGCRAVSRRPDDELPAAVGSAVGVVAAVLAAAAPAPTTARLPSHPARQTPAFSKGKWPECAPAVRICSIHPAQRDLGPWSWPAPHPCGGWADPCRAPPRRVHVRYRHHHPCHLSNQAGCLRGPGHVRRCRRGRPQQQPQQPPPRTSNRGEQTPRSRAPRLCAQK
jgi:hypothetical protein